VNFHKSTLLTDSDRRKYKDLFAKIVANEMTTSLPVLGAISTVQSTKPKFNKGPATISMPTNLNTLIENEVATNSSSSNSNNAQLESATTTTNASNWMSCSDVPVSFRPQLPCLAIKNNISGSSSNGNTNKAHLARQVTNVIKRHNIEARQQLLTDKII
jgi:hypothetical protein